MIVLNKINSGRNLFIGCMGAAPASQHLDYVNHLDRIIRDFANTKYTICIDQEKAFEEHSNKKINSLFYICVRERGYFICTNSLIEFQFHELLIPFIVIFHKDSQKIQNMFNAFQLDSINKALPLIIDKIH